MAVRRVRYSWRDSFDLTHLDGAVMLVVLDTTAIMSDFRCRGIAWRVLAAAAADWDVRILVPEVVIIEATAGYQREISKAERDLQSWADKHEGRLGVTAGHSETKDALSAASKSYVDDLRDRLAKLGVTIVPPPEIAHLTLVERAASRRRPMDDAGDGYRDALNWHTVLSLASQHPDSRIIWVSDNIHDFGARGDGSKLHDHLIEDLTTVNACDRVSWVRTLQDLILSLAADHTPGTTDLAEIQDAVRKQSLITFIRNEVIPTAEGRSLDPIQVALPLGTLSGSITSIAEPKDIEFGQPGQGPGNETIIQFSFSASTEISARPLPNLTVDGLRSSNETDRIIYKPLMYSGIVTADEYGRANEGELTVIEAMSDDPGLILWARADNTILSPSLAASKLTARSRISAEFLNAALESIENPNKPVPSEIMDKVTKIDPPLTNVEMLGFLLAMLALYIQRKNNRDAAESNNPKTKE